ncbi:MAG: response regulator transcription factor, partial [Azovibrio sp.]
MRILVVEDSPILATQISEALVESGYVAELSNNGRDALYQGQEENFDAVILDLGLPEIDGLTVLSQWRASGKTMPVLILTARDNWHEKVAGIDAGADDYLTKPFHMEELLARIRALIRRTHGHASAQ